MLTALSQRTGICITDSARLLASFNICLYGRRNSFMKCTGGEKDTTDLIWSYIYCSYGLNADSLRSNDSDDEYDDDASASGQEDIFGGEAVLAWAEVCVFYGYFGLLVKFKRPSRGSLNSRLISNCIITK